MPSLPIFQTSRQVAFALGSCAFALCSDHPAGTTDQDTFQTHPLQFNLLAGFRNSNLYRVQETGSALFGKRGFLSMEVEQHFTSPGAAFLDRWSLFGSVMVYGSEEAKYKGTPSGVGGAQDAIAASEGLRAYFGGSMRLLKNEGSQIQFDLMARSFFTMLSRPILDSNGAPVLDQGGRPTFAFRDRLQSAADFGFVLRSTNAFRRGSLVELAFRNHDPAFPENPRRLIIRGRAVINLVPEAYGTREAGWFSGEYHAWFLEADANRTWRSGSADGKDEVVLSAGYIYRF